MSKGYKFLRCLSGMAIVGSGLMLRASCPTPRERQSTETTSVWVHRCGQDGLPLDHHDLTLHTPPTALPRLEPHRGVTSSWHHTGHRTLRATRTVVLIIKT